MTSKLDRWRAAVDKRDTNLDAPTDFEMACEQAMPPLLEIARLAAKGWVAQDESEDLTANEVERYDALLREVTEDE